MKSKMYKVLDVREIVNVSGGSYSREAYGSGGSLNVGSSCTTVVIAENEEGKRRRFNFYPASKEFSFGKVYYYGTTGDYDYLVPGDMFELEEDGTWPNVKLLTHNKFKNKIERSFDDKEYVIELTDDEVERVFRLRDKEYRKEDAKRHLLDHFDIDVNDYSKAKMEFAQTIINEDGGNFNLEDISSDDNILKYLVDEFYDNEDCNIAENDTWQNVIKDFLRDRFNYIF